MRKPVRLKLASSRYKPERVEKLKKILEDLLPKPDSINLPLGKLEVLNPHDTSKSEYTEIIFIDACIGRSLDARSQNEYEEVRRISEENPHGINILLTSKTNPTWQQVMELSRGHIHQLIPLPQTESGLYRDVVRQILRENLEFLIRDGKIMVPPSIMVIGGGTAGLNSVKLAAEEKARNGSFERIGFYSHRKFMYPKFKSYISFGVENVTFHDDLKEGLDEPQYDVIVVADGKHIKDYDNFKSRDENFIEALTRLNKRKVLKDIEAIGLAESFFIHLSNSPEVFARSHINRFGIREDSGRISSAYLDLSRLCTFYREVSKDIEIVEKGMEAYLRQTHDRTTLEQGSKRIKDLFFHGMHGLGAMDDYRAKFDETSMIKLAERLKDREYRMKFMRLFFDLGLYQAQSAKELVISSIEVATMTVNLMKRFAYFNPDPGVPMGCLQRFNGRDFYCGASARMTYTNGIHTFPTRYASEIKHPDSIEELKKEQILQERLLAKMLGK